MSGKRMVIPLLPAMGFHSRFSFATSQVACPVPRDALIFWVGFINPGYELPPIGDPEAFLKLTKTHSGGERNQDWQNRESHGDVVAGDVIYSVLLDHKIYGSFYRMCASSLKSNIYWEKLVRQYDLLDLCHVPSDDKRAYTSFVEKRLADVFEVRPLSPHLFRQALGRTD
jgi:hypothetical protein